MPLGKNSTWTDSVENTKLKLFICCSLIDSLFLFFFFLPRVIQICCLRFKRPDRKKLNLFPFGLKRSHALAEQGSREWGCALLYVHPPTDPTMPICGGSHGVVKLSLRLMAHSLCFHPSLVMEARHCNSYQNHLTETLTCRPWYSRRWSKGKQWRVK